MIDIVKNIGLYAGTCLSVIAVLSFIIKPIRNRFMSWIKDTSRVDNTDKLLVELKDSFDTFSGEIKQDIKELKADSELNKEANKCVCSNRIANAAEKYRSEDSIPNWEIDSLIDHFTVYQQLGGNGKIARKYQELMEKPIKSG